MLAREGLFEWGLAPPLEKVIETPEQLSALRSMPGIYRQGVSVIEPWRDVGDRAATRYQELKQSDGIRLVIRMLHHGMQE